MSVHSACHVNVVIVLGYATVVLLLDEKSVICQEG